MTQEEYHLLLSPKARKLRIIGVLWILVVAFIGTAGATNDAGLLQETKVGEVLSNGSAQAVLAVVVLGLTGAVMYLTRSLFNVQQERVRETKELFEEKITANTERMAENTEVLTELKSGLHDMKTASDAMKASTDECRRQQLERK